MSRRFSIPSVVLATFVIVGCAVTRVTIPTPLGPCIVEFDPNSCTENKDGSATCTVCTQEDSEACDSIKDRGGKQDSRSSLDSVDGGADGECFEHTFTPEQVREFKKRYVTALRTSSDLWEEDALFDMTK